MDAPYSDALQELLRLPGARYSCIADAVSGRVLAEHGKGVVDPAAVLGWGGAALRDLDGADDLDDLIVTGARAYHLVRRAAAGGGPPLLVYVCLERARSNLALARRALAGVVVAPLPPTAEGGAVAPVPFAPPSSTDPWPPPVAPAPRAPSPPAAVPLPRRTRTAVPAAAPVPQPRAAGPRWAGDLGTMRRLLAGLRALQ
jgi:hypothetical protein